MFDVWKLIWTIFTLPACNIIDGEWICPCIDNEEPLIAGAAGCDNRFLFLSDESKQTLMNHQQGFIQFADHYFRNYAHPRRKTRATAKFLETVFNVQLDLAKYPNKDEERWIYQALYKSYEKLVALAQEPLDFELIPEYKGVHHALRKSLRGLHHHHYNEPTQPPLNQQEEQEFNNRLLGKS